VNEIECLIVRRVAVEMKQRQGGGSVPGDHVRQHSPIAPQAKSRLRNGVGKFAQKRLRPHDSPLKVLGNAQIGL
jgi:hypothetical protein